MEKHRKLTIQKYNSKYLQFESTIINCRSPYAYSKYLRIEALYIYHNVSLKRERFNKDHFAITSSLSKSSKLMSIS